MRSGKPATTSMPHATAAELLRAASGQSQFWKGMHFSSALVLMVLPYQDGSYRSAGARPGGLGVVDEVPLTHSERLKSKIPSTCTASSRRGQWHPGKDGTHSCSRGPIFSRNRPSSQSIVCVRDVCSCRTQSPICRTRQGAAACARRGLFRERLMRCAGSLGAGSFASPMQTLTGRISARENTMKHEMHIDSIS